MSSDALRKVGVEVSLDFRTAREFLEEMAPKGTLSERDWGSDLRRAP